MAQHKHAVGIVNSVPPHSIAWQIVVCCGDWVKPGVGSITVLFDICLVRIEGHIEGVCAITSDARDFAIIFVPVCLSEGAQEGIIGHIKSGHASIVGVNANVEDAGTLCHCNWVAIRHSIGPSFVIVPCRTVPMGDCAISELTKLTHFPATNDQVCPISPQFVDLVASIAGQARSRSPFCQPLACRFVVACDAVFGSKHHFTVVFDNLTDWEIEISIVPFSKHSAVCSHVLKGVFAP